MGSTQPAPAQRSPSGHRRTWLARQHRRRSWRARHGMPQPHARDLIKPSHGVPRALTPPPPCLVHLPTAASLAWAQPLPLAEGCPPIRWLRMACRMESVLSGASPRRAKATENPPIAGDSPERRRLWRPEPAAKPPSSAGFRLPPFFTAVDGVFWYTKHVHYTLVWIWLWN
jgi:hypothetical protein